MRFSCLVLAVLFALSALVSRSAHADPPLAPYGKKWSYVWGDEFNGTTLDTSKWRLNREASRRGDRLHDGYLIRWRWEDDNVSVQDGNLVLTNTRQTPFEDADDLVMAAGINSKRGFNKTYGYFEARIKIAPTADGIHTAFWLYRSPQSSVTPGGADGAEIDIMESPFVTNHYNIAVHWDGNLGDASRRPLSLHDGSFHVFAVDWDDQEYRFYADHRLVHTYRGPGVSQSDEYLILSTGASWRHGNAHTGTFPNHAYVDWVWVWELVDDPDINMAPTGRPAISGSARVGETLEASADAVEDEDGLTNATFAWQWITNDGARDTPIPGATGSSYTLTQPDFGKTIKVRVTFTDDGGTEEALTSVATAPVTGLHADDGVGVTVAVLPSISIRAAAAYAREGEDAVFTLLRTGSAVDALTVPVTVAESGMMLGAAVPKRVEFAAGAPEAQLRVPTAADGADETDSVVTARIETGPGHRVASTAGSATATVLDDDAPAGTTEVLWSADVTVTDFGGAFGAITSDSFTNVTGDELGVEWIWYSVGVRRLDLILSEAATDADELTLHLDDVALAFPQGNSGESTIRWRPIRLSWRNGQTVAVRLSRTSQAPEPVNTSPTGLPAIAGTPRVGEALRASVSGIADADGLSGAAFGYQWLSHDGTADTAISGATQAVYTLAASDAGNTIKVRVSFTDDGGTEETLTSAATAAVEATAPDAPRNLSIAAPDGKEGVLEVSWVAPSSDGGSALTGYKVQWRSGFEDYDGTAASTRQAVVTDLTALTHTISGLTNGVAYTVRVIATNGVGDGAATARVTGTPRDRVRPQLAAAAVDGDTLTLTWNEALDEGSTPPTHAFDVVVGGALRGVTAVSVSGSTVTLTLAPAVAPGNTVTVRYMVTSTSLAARIKDAAGNPAKEFFSGEVTNNTSARVNTPPTGLPSISGAARVGETLTASAFGIADADGLSGATFAWQWISNDGTSDTEIAGATQATYTLADADAGKIIKVRATYTDDGGTEETLTSAGTAAVEAAVPGAPRNLTLAVPNRVEGALEVSWSAPPGGAAVTGYKVQWKSGSEDYDGTASSTRQATVTDPANLTYTITGLTNGVAYTVRVIAVNDAGDGTASGETTGSPLSRVSQLRYFIENDIVAVYGAAHPWLHAAWGHMNGPRFRLRVFDPSEGSGVYNLPSNSHGYVSAPCASFSNRLLPRCRAEAMVIRDTEINSPIIVIHEMAHVYTLTDQLSSYSTPLGVAHVYFEQIGLRSGNRPTCSGRDIYADILTKLVLGDIPTPYWNGHSCGAAGQTQEALSVARSALGGRMPQWFAATYHDVDGDPDLEEFWADVQTVFFSQALVISQLRNAFGVFRDSCGRTSHEDKWVEIMAAENAEPEVAADGVPQQDDAAALRHAHRRQESREILPRGLDGVFRVRAGPPPHVPAPAGLRKAHVSPRLHSTRFSARCAQIHCRSWTGIRRVSQNR